MTQRERVLEETALAFHGGLVFGHLVGAVYNWRRTGRFFSRWVLIHVAGAALSAGAMHAHARSCV
jgi:hypothetical protein